MIKQDLHMHTTFCDGKSSAEEMVLSAIEKGLKRVGISGHSYLPFDDACMKEEAVDDYIKEIKRLKVKYQDEIEVLLGLEKDQCSKCDTAPYDYVIGSVHYLQIGEDHVCVDYGLDKMKAAVEKRFNGDYLAYAEYYYETIGGLDDCDIVGHFDIVTKFNEREQLIDVESQRYRDAYKKAADKLLKRGLVFEINTGAISRGYRTSPYPSKEIIDYLKANGGKFILSSDAHHKDNIAFKFEDYEYLING